MKRQTPLIISILILSTTALGLSITDIEISPSNRLYKDDTFNVTVKLNGVTCNRGVRISIDNKYSWTLVKFYRKCSVEEVFSGNWDLKEKPLNPGSHVVLVEILDEWLFPERSNSEIIHILDKDRPTTSTSTTSTTSTSTTSTTSTSTTSTTSTSTTSTTLTTTSIVSTTSTTSSSTTTTSSITLTTTSIPTTTTAPKNKGIMDQIIDFILNLFRGIFGF